MELNEFEELLKKQIKARVPAYIVGFGEKESGKSGQALHD